MDFKKLFMNSKAVSPVIGVILMVAITVILAAAIGSTVFGEGTAESAPQANFNIKAGPITTSTGSVIIEHIGGDPIHFEKDTVTKVTASVDGGSSATITATALGTMGVGDTKSLTLTAAAGSTTPVISTGKTVNIKIIDVETNQLICDKDVRF